MTPEIKKFIGKGLVYVIPTAVVLSSIVGTAVIIEQERSDVKQQVDSKLPALPSVDALKWGKAKRSVDAFDQKVLEAIEKKGSATVNLEEVDNIDSVRMALAILDEQKAAEERDRLRIALKNKLVDQDAVWRIPEEAGIVALGLILGLGSGYFLNKRFNKRD